MFKLFISGKISDPLVGKFQGGVSVSGWDLEVMVVVLIFSFEPLPQVGYSRQDMSSFPGV